MLATKYPAHILDEQAPRPAMPAAVGVLDALRRDTQALHRALDSRIPLAQAEPSWEQYQAHVGHVAVWLARWMALEQSSAADPLAPGRIARYADLLALAQADLGRTFLDPEMAVADLPADAREPAFRWGVAYVVEGSQLGGAVLHRRLSGALAPHALHYLAGDGAPAGSRFRAFVATLEQAVSTPSQVQQACRGAVAAFTELMRSFGIEPPPAPASAGRTG